MILYQNEHVKAFVDIEHRWKTEYALESYREMDKPLTDEKIEVYIRIEENKVDSFYVAFVTLFSDIVFVYNMKRVKTEPRMSNNN